MNWEERIVIDPAVLVGKPVIRGTRLAVAFVIDLLAHGWSEDDVLCNYPGVEREDIRACLAYAGAIVPLQRLVDHADGEPVRSAGDGGWSRRSPYCRCSSA